MIPVNLKHELVECTTQADDPLNTLDNIPLSFTLNTSGILCRMIEGECPIKLIWDKLSHNDMLNAFQIPVELAGLNPDRHVIDDLMDEINDARKPVKLRMISFFFQTDQKMA